MTDLLTTAQAASLAGVRPATWRSWVERGHVIKSAADAPVMVGPVATWRRATVERVIAERKHARPGRPPKPRGDGP